MPISTNDIAAQAVFLASLPTGDAGRPTPGHTNWDDLGPKGKDRYCRMAQAVYDAPAPTPPPAAVVGLRRELLRLQGRNSPGFIPDAVMRAINAVVDHYNWEDK